ncbi:MAG: hypothetical protein MI919_23240 [Holophagales bacterium]|nr:hypothetical protein [Holophagales bacterium]
MLHSRLLLAALVACPLLPADGAFAAVPGYGPPQLQARSNFTGAFNLPDSAFFSSSTASIAAGDRVAIRVGVIAGVGGQGVWFGGNGQGSIVHISPDGSSISDVHLSDAGEVVYPQTFSVQDGLYVWRQATGMAAFETSQPLGSSGWGSPRIDGEGRIGFRASFSGDHAFASWDGISSTAIHAAEVSIEPTSDYSFLFTPSFGSDRRIAAKVRLGGPGQVAESQPDEIRIFASDGTSVLVAEDRDSNAASPFFGFDNGVTLSEAGTVAFTATLAGGVRGVFLGSDSGPAVEIAREGDPGLTEIEFFAPETNSAGVVAFRGVDGSGLQAIFAGDGAQLARLIGEHDLVATDLGTGRIDQNDSSTVFGGGLSINEDGSIAFVAALTPEDDDQIEWGSGLFVLSASAIFADGFESGSTEAW